MVGLFSGEEAQRFFTLMIGLFLLLFATFITLSGVIFGEKKWKNLYTSFFLSSVISLLLYFPFFTLLITARQHFGVENDRTKEETVFYLWLLFNFIVWLFLGILIKIWMLNRSKKIQ